MKNKIKWIVVNGIFCVFLYLGLIEGNVGAMRVVTFFVTILTLITFTMFSEDAQKILKERGRAMPVRIDVTYDFIIVGFLLWFGATYEAIVYTVHIFFQFGAFEKALQKDEVESDVK